MCKNEQYILVSFETFHLFLHQGDKNEINIAYNNKKKHVYTVRLKNDKEITTKRKIV
jgi:hypothetical protein